MSYIDKSKQSLEVAEFCYENKCYDSCVNRYYYSFYQELMDKLSKKGISIDDRNISGGSHERAFNNFIDKVLRPIKRVKPREITKLRTEYGNLKNLRNLADYKPESISKKDVDEAIKMYNNLKKEINII